MFRQTAPDCNVINLCSPLITEKSC